MSSGKWWPFCLGLNVLMNCSDMTIMRGYRDGSPSNDHQETCSIDQKLLNLSEIKTFSFYNSYVHLDILLSSLGSIQLLTHEQLTHEQIYPHSYPWCSWSERSYALWSALFSGTPNRHTCRVSNISWPAPVFCLLLGRGSDCAQPITGQVTEVFWLYTVSMVRCFYNTDQYNMIMHTAL